MYSLGTCIDMCDVHQWRVCVCVCVDLLCVFVSRQCPTPVYFFVFVCARVCELPAPWTAQAFPRLAGLHVQYRRAGQGVGQ